MPREAPYLKVSDDLRRRVLAGEWRVGERLPGRSTLAGEYGVGPNVVQRATERLIIEGLLEGRAGSGTYVRTPRERLRMLRTRRRVAGDGPPFRARMRDQGKSGSWESHSTARVPAPEPIAARLGIDPGDHTVHTAYELLADGQPVELAESWEPMAVTGGTPVVLPEYGPFAGRGVVDRMRAIGVHVARATEVPRPARATQEQANMLGISLGDLVTVIERTYYDTAGRPVETADIVVPDIRWEIAYEIPVEQPGA